MKKENYIKISFLVSSVKINTRIQRRRNFIADLKVEPFLNYWKKSYNWNWNPLTVEYQELHDYDYKEYTKDSLHKLPSVIRSVRVSQTYQLDVDVNWKLVC